MAAVKPGPEPTPWALDVGTRMLAELERVMSSVSAGSREAEVLAALGSPKRRSTGAGDALQFLVYAPFTLPDADFLSDTDIPVEVQLGFDVPPGASEAVWAGSVVVTTESQNEIDPEDGLEIGRAHV